MTTIIYNEADEYYEVHTGGQPRRYPTREVALHAAMGYGPIELVGWSDEGAAWANEAIRRHDEMHQRIDAIVSKLRPSRRQMRRAAMGYGER